MTARGVGHSQALATQAVFEYSSCVVVANVVLVFVFLNLKFKLSWWSYYSSRLVVVSESASGTPALTGSVSHGASSG